MDNHNPPDLTTSHFRCSARLTIRNLNKVSNSLTKVNGILENLSIIEGMSIVVNN